MSVPRIVTAGIFVSLLLVMSARGATSSARSYGPNGSNPRAANVNRHQQQLASAQSELSTAQATLDHLKEQAQRALATTPAWTKAKAAVAQAEKDKRATHDQITSRVTASPEYQALAQHADAAKSETERADDHAKMANMVWDAVAASPEWSEAQAKLNRANADVAAQWKAYESDVLAHDQAWTSALAARDAARARVSAALRNPTGTPGVNRSSGYRSGRNSYGSSNRSSRSSRYSSSSRYR